VVCVFLFDLSNLSQGSASKKAKTAVTYDAASGSAAAGFCLDAFKTQGSLGARKYCKAQHRGPTISRPI
jgi:hypothetical protein